MDYIDNDFLQIFHYQEKTDFDFIVKQILYTKKSIWIIQQYIYSETYENLIDILNNNIKELLTTFLKSDVIKYIINNLLNIYNTFKIYKLNNLFLKLFFNNINKDILTKIVKIIIYKNKYYKELYDFFVNIGINTAFEPLINEFNNLTIKHILNKNIVDSYKIYVNNNKIVLDLFNSNLKCIEIIIGNTLDYIEKNDSIYIDIQLLYIGKDIKKYKLLSVIETYLLNLHKNITEYNIFDGELLKNIVKHFNYIYELKCLQNVINYPLIIKKNINSIFHNDKILKYFIFGLSKVIMYMVHLDDSINIIYNIITHLKFFNNIDILLQYYYESLKIRVKYFLINNINHNTILNVENKLIEYLELINLSKLQIYNDIYNYIDNLKTSIDFKQTLNSVDNPIFITKKLKIELYNINIPDIFIKNVDIIKNHYSYANRQLELSYKDTVVTLSLDDNVTITGSLIPMTMLYYYGSCDNIDIFNVMFNNQNEELMDNTLNILKNNNLLIDNKIIIPKKNIILNENIINYNKIIEKINYDRNTITKCYIMKTAKTLKKNITNEELYNFTKTSLNYFVLEYDRFENMLKYCIEKELLNVNSSGLLEY